MPTTARCSSTRSHHHAVTTEPAVCRDAEGLQVLRLRSEGPDFHYIAIDGESRRAATKDDGAVEATRRVRLKSMSQRAFNERYTAVEDYPAERAARLFLGFAEDLGANANALDELANIAKLARLTPLDQISEKDLEAEIDCLRGSTDAFRWDALCQEVRRRRRADPAVRARLRAEWEGRAVEDLSDEQIDTELERLTDLAHDDEWRRYAKRWGSLRYEQRRRGGFPRSGISRDGSEEGVYVHFGNGPACDWMLRFGELIDRQVGECKHAEAIANVLSDGALLDEMRESLAAGDRDHVLRVMRLYVACHLGPEGEGLFDREITTKLTTSKRRRKPST